MNGPLGIGVDIGRWPQRGLTGMPQRQNLATRQNVAAAPNPGDPNPVQRKDFWSDLRDDTVGAVEDVFRDPVRGTLAVATGGLSELAYYQPRDALGRLTEIPSPDLSGSEALAQLYRRDWQDYLRDFANPGGVEDQLIGSYRNLGDRREARGLALQDVNRGFDQAQAALGDRLGRYGLAMTPQQQAEQQRRSGFARGLAEIEAINRTSRRMDDRDMELMTTGARAPALPGVG